MENKPELIFTDLPVDRAFRPLEYPITGELVQEFMETVGDRNPLYWDEALAQEKLLGPPVAPPGLAAIYARVSYLQDYTMPSGGVLAKQEFEFLGPIRIGDTLKVEARVVESYLDEKGRKRVTFLIRAENQKSVPISTIRLYAIWPK
ncbi:MAG: MaoC family dehydratase [Thermodesulfobacteriota bacterium]|nr:MaoC family dehydratase [Thermodesulfobacteriota bacterium]